MKTGNVLSVQGEQHRGWGHVGETHLDVHAWCVYVRVRVCTYVCLCVRTCPSGRTHAAMEEVPLESTLNAVSLQLSPAFNSQIKSHLFLHLFSLSLPLTDKHTRTHTHTHTDTHDTDTDTHTGQWEQSRSVSQHSRLAWLITEPAAFALLGQQIGSQREDTETKGEPEPIDISPLSPQRLYHRQLN